jgi:outer membrane protein assembly factor BamB
MTQRIHWIIAALLIVTGCDSLTPSWLRGAERTIKRTPGERVDVIFSPSKLMPDASVADTTIDIPEQANLSSWASLNTAMETPHIGLTGITREEHTTIGDGNDFSGTYAPTPLVVDGMVIAMDAAGIVSAHDESALNRTVWVNNEGVMDDKHDLGGGLAYADGVVYACLGTGEVRAISLKDGKNKWSIRVGAPVRGNPAVSGGIVAVLTADNQTIALDNTTGETRWSHRGIREVASYVSRTSPVIKDGVVITAYSSGELFALNAESGSVIWSDTLGGSIKTRASAVFSGIAADPIVQDGVVVVVTTNGEMQASALANGRPLWQSKIGGHATPWSAGNVLYVLSDTHDVAAVFKRDGLIRWATSLAVADKRDATKDITPALYGPILAGNAVLVLDAKGMLTTFKPEDGKVINSYELAEGTVTAPIVANGALYIITRDATLYRYR